MPSQNHLCISYSELSSWRHKSMTWWHTCTITRPCRKKKKKKKTLLFSRKAYVAAPGAVLTFEFSSRTNPVALFTWGQGGGWGCHGNPCWCSSGRDEQREGGAAVAAAAAATHQHRDLSLSLFPSSLLVQMQLLSRHSLNLSLSLTGVTTITVYRVLHRSRQ